MLFDGDESKPLPVMLTLEPTTPEAGVNDVITGNTTLATVLRNTDTDPDALAMATSGAPSPSMSPMARPFGVTAVLKNTAFSNDEVESDPGVLMFLYTNA